MKKGTKHSEEAKSKMKKSHLGKVFSDEHRKNLSVALNGIKNPFYGKTHSKRTREKMSRNHADVSGNKHPMFGKPRSDITKQKIRENQPNRLGINNPNFGKKMSNNNWQKLDAGRKHYFITYGHPFLGKHHSIESKRKQRIAALNRILRDGTELAIGLNEKPLLDAQEQIDNVQILRQYPIMKLGYIVDGYCPETNTVYEVYENAHDRTVFEDLQRETEICNLLSCDFIIIWDRSH